MYKIKKNPNHGPRHEFYRNVAFYHLPRPTLKDKILYDIDGEKIPIIHISIK